jgi:hypothetical protein
VGKQSAPPPAYRTRDIGRNWPILQVFSRRLIRLSVIESRATLSLMAFPGCKRRGSLYFPVCTARMVHKSSLSNCVLSK